MKLGWGYRVLSVFFVSLAVAYSVVITWWIVRSHPGVFRIVFGFAAPALALWWLAAVVFYVPRWIRKAVQREGASLPARQRK
jgi:hypothetical protein